MKLYKQRRQFVKTKRKVTIPKIERIDFDCPHCGKEKIVSLSVAFHDEHKGQGQIKVGCGRCGHILAI